MGLGKRKGYGMIMFYENKLEFEMPCCIFFNAM